MNLLLNILLWIAAIAGIVVAAIFLASIYVNLRYNRFLARHALPKDLEQLLAVGALIPRANGHATRVLAVDCSKGKLLELLEAYWDIDGEDSARERLHDMIAGGWRESRQAHFERLQAGENALYDLPAECLATGLLELPDTDWEFDGEDSARGRINDMIEGNVAAAKEAWTTKGLPAEAIRDCRSMAAFDYDRIASLARYCHQAGLLDEATTWRCIAWAVRQARDEFASWEDYAASLILGRTAYYDSERLDRMLEATVQLLKESEGGIGGGAYPHLWQIYRLADVRIPAHLLDGHLLEDLRPHSSSAQGALINAPIL